MTKSEAQSAEQSGGTETVTLAKGVEFVDALSDAVTLNAHCTDSCDAKSEHARPEADALPSWENENGEVKLATAGVEEPLSD